MGAENAEGGIHEHYQPKPVETTMISRRLCERTEDDLNEPGEAWEIIAASMADYAYWKQGKMRDESLDEQIEKTIERADSWKT